MKTGLQLVVSNSINFKLFSFFTIIQCGRRYYWKMITNFGKYCIIMSKFPHMSTSVFQRENLASLHVNDAKQIVRVVIDEDEDDDDDSVPINRGVRKSIHARIFIVNCQLDRFQWREKPDVDNRQRPTD